MRSLIFPSSSGRGELPFRLFRAGLKPAPTVRGHVDFGIVALVGFWRRHAQSRLRHRRIGGILGLSYWHVDPGIIVL